MSKNNINFDLTVIIALSGFFGISNINDLLSGRKLIFFVTLVALYALHVRNSGKHKQLLSSLINLIPIILIEILLITSVYYLIFIKIDIFNITIFIIYSLLLIISTLFTSKNINSTKYKSPYKSEVFFEEHFKLSKLDEHTWIVSEYPDAPILNGQLELKMTSNREHFHYIRSSNKLTPDKGNFIVKIKFRYTSVEGNGTGIVFTPELIPDRVSLEEAYKKPWTFRIWQDQTNFTIGFSGNEIQLSKKDQSEHLVEVHWNKSFATIYIDGSKYQEQDLTNFNTRSMYIWLGNFAQIGHLARWSEFIVNSIEIIEN